MAERSFVFVGRLSGARVRARVAGAGFAACAVVLLATGCESSQDRSAAIARTVSHSVAAASKPVGGGAANSSVRVLKAQLVSGGGRTAAVLQLVDGGSVAQADVPLVINVTDNAGKSLYSNDTAGLEPSLSQIAALAPGKPAWWVDDQVLVAGKPSAVKVHVGTSKVHAAVAPASISVTGLKLGSLNGLAYLQASVVNNSSRAQSQLPVFVVGLNGGKIVAAGRALVPALPAGPHAKPVSVQIFLVGKPKGATFQVTVAATQ